MTPQPANRPMLDPEGFTPINSVPNQTDNLGWTKPFVTTGAKQQYVVLSDGSTIYGHHFNTNAAWRIRTSRGLSGWTVDANLIYVQDGPTLAQYNMDDLTPDVDGAPVVSCDFSALPRPAVRYSAPVIVQRDGDAMIYVLGDTGMVYGLPTTLVIDPGIPQMIPNVPDAAELFLGTGDQGEPLLFYPSSGQVVILAFDTHGRATPRTTVPMPLDLPHWLSSMFIDRKTQRQIYPKAGAPCTQLRCFELNNASQWIVYSAWWGLQDTGDGGPAFSLNWGAGAYNVAGNYLPESKPPTQGEPNRQFASFSGIVVATPKESGFSLQGGTIASNVVSDALLSRDKGGTWVAHLVTQAPGAGILFGPDQSVSLAQYKLKEIDPDDAVAQLLAVVLGSELSSARTWAEAGGIGTPAPFRPELDSTRFNAATVVARTPFAPQMEFMQELGHQPPVVWPVSQRVPVLQMLDALIAAWSLEYPWFLAFVLNLSCGYSADEAAGAMKMRGL